MADEDVPELINSFSSAFKLARNLARFDQGLSETLRNLRDAHDAGQQSELSVKAGRIADMYLGYLSVDPLIAHVEAKPYEVNAAVRETLSAPLMAIKTGAAKAAAPAN